MIPFNKPYLTGKELVYIKDAVSSGHISGNGKYTKKCHQFFKNKYGFKNTLLTTSCTDALEMAAILMNIKDGDEIIMPSYTFVSTANAFVLRGAKIVFADSLSNNPNINPKQIKELITSKTRAIVVVHYSGLSCDMDAIMQIANKHKIYVVEDAAQAIDSYYKGTPLGSIGHLSTFSFHETKNIISGEGGMLVVNDEQLANRAEIIWEKGTNRAAFFRGETDKYNWVDIGSSFLPSELIAAFLYSQLQHMEKIINKRRSLWSTYNKNFNELYKEGKLKPQNVPQHSSNNGHIFYFLCSSSEERRQLIKYLKEKEIQAVFHYISLHSSPFFKKKYKGKKLENSDFFSNHLVRLPLYYELTNSEQEKIINEIKSFYA
jgi:dTDP-4-amino-4,6-dideoxygalactose transaminase